MRGKSVYKKILPIAFWLMVWQIAAALVGQQLLLASPVQTLRRFVSLGVTTAFWQSALFSMAHILLGYLIAIALGAALAGLAARFSWVQALLHPLLVTLKAIPVASFVIVALIWVPSRQLSTLVSFLIALPVIYAGTLGGLREVNRELLEMAQVFRVPKPRRVLHLYIPAALPQFSTACEVAMGLAWKSGVAAEVIGIPTGSIGEKLYKAKVYLATPDLFAWTLAIILLSFVCERVFIRLLDFAIRRTERM